MWNGFRVLVAALVLLLGSAGQAPALPLIVDFVDFLPSQAKSFDVPGVSTVGWQFEVSAPITIGQLALWNDFTNGVALAHPHDVGLWRLDGTLLASVTITNASPFIPTGEDPLGRWHYEAISPIVLAPGPYVLGQTLFQDEDDFVRTNATVTEIAGVTFLGARRTSVASSSLAFPDALAPTQDGGIFGPNAGIVDAQPQPVPAPAGLVLLGLGLSGVAVLRWRRLSGLARAS